MTSYTFRIEDDLKQQAFSVFRSYGLNPAQAIKMFLRQVAETKSIPVQLDYQPNEETAQAIDDLRHGDYEVVSSVDDLVAQIKAEQNYGDQIF